MYRQVLDPLAGSLALSALCAAVPLLTLFVLLGVFRVKAHIAAITSLVLAVALAVGVWGMPLSQGLSGAAEGGFYGLFPILWILVNALWIYRLTEITGWFGVLRRSIRTVSPDQRIQGILIAFCFGALIEALAGFGTPVAITAVMLIAVGIDPIKAATVALVANTAPVAFGSMGVPLTTMAGVTGLPLEDLGAMAGRQTPVIAAFIPLVLVFLVDGKRGVRQTWPVAVVAGLAFGVGQFLAANYVSVEVTDIIAGVVAVVAVLGFLRVWTPGEIQQGTQVPAVAGGSVDSEAEGTAFDAEMRRRETGEGSALMAFAPYLIIVALFAFTQLGPIKDWLATNGVHQFTWPGLDVVSPSGKPASAMTFKLEHLKAAGTILLAAGLITMALYRVGPGRAVRAYGATLHQLRWTVVTVMSVLALAWVMNLSGQTATLGTALAESGEAFALLSPIVGWLGVAVTGSDTSANSLFGVLQVTAAKETGLDPVLLAAANSTGGVLGKMISPQNLAVAAAAIGMAGSESTIFRRVIGWSLGLTAAFAVFIYLQSTPVLGWMTI
ncbi:L-lactate permease [Actinomadura rudentiformis]|uniref:L-lactate permease n=1 Tax=Actinomadura rudentiformis TaxID=359158 RepID=A0A6H9YWJ4_9ACTN|nr:L-lactate permease [Actinomadura rudentiformis]KAB2348351.1 L-lactate permease [Actinomadura rudentiformis]